MKLNRTESPLSRTERNKINENWQVIESKYNSFAGEWQEPVDSESELPSEANEGDTRMARDTGKVFRFNGNEWQEIQDISVSPVNELEKRMNKRIDGIITNPAEGVSEQEIIDARQGWDSLGANLSDIRSMITNSALNLVTNGDFRDEEDVWGGSASSNISNGVLSVEYGGTTNYFRTQSPYKPKKYPEVNDVLYARCLFHSNDLSNIRWISFSSHNGNTSHRFEPDFNLSTGEWVIQSATITNEISDFNESANDIFIKAQVLNSGQASGTSFDIKNLMWLNLTDIYGAGNEPSKEEMDQLFEKHQLPYWEDYFMIDQFYLLKLIDEASKSGGGQSEEQKLEDLMWTWHTFPMSIYSQVANMTFLGGVQRGGANNGHNIYSIDEFTNEIKGNQLSNRFSGDDHNMVALADLYWNRQIMAFYAGHSGDGIYYKLINNYDVDSLGDEHKIPGSEGATYINILKYRQTDTMYIISRISGEGYCIFYTDDWGQNWTKKQLFDGNYYVDTGKRLGRDTTLGITVTGHGGGGFPEIYYCYLTIEGTIHLPDGTQIADIKTGAGLPLDITDLKLVAENPGSRTTVSSVNGHRHSLTFIHSEDESFETFNYKYAIYNSSSDDFEIYDVEQGVKGNLMSTTHPHYVGSCHDFGINYPQIYLSKYNDEIDRWEIWDYSNMNARPVEGWNKTKVDESHLKLFRPISTLPDGTLRKPLPGFWLKGYFSTYTDYYADAQMPFDME